MRININNQVFDQGKFIDVLGKEKNIPLLKESNWFLKNKFASGSVKDIRADGVCYLSYKLDMYKDDELFVSYKKPLFKLHFEFENDVKYKAVSNTKNYIIISKGAFELVYLENNSVLIESCRKTKNSVEIFFDETYIKRITGDGFIHLLSFIKEVLKNTLNENKNIFISDEISKIINDINNCEFTGVKRQVYLDLKLKELIIISITFYQDNYKSDEFFDFDREGLIKVDNYIKENLKKDLTIPSLSIIAGMNTSKFKKSFKLVYGITVFKYITSLRIETAKKLIHQKAYTVSQASYEVGYKNAQHFTVAFKKSTGYLPSELKKSNK